MAGERSAIRKLFLRAFSTDGAGDKMQSIASGKYRKGNKHSRQLVRFATRRLKHERHKKDPRFVLSVQPAFADALWPVMRCHRRRLIKGGRGWPNSERAHTVNSSRREHFNECSEWSVQASSFRDYDTFMTIPELCLPAAKTRTAQRLTF